MKYNIKMAFIIVGFIALQSSRAETTIKTNSDNLQIELTFVGGAHSTPGPDDDIICGLTDLTSNRTIFAVYQPEISYGCRSELFDANGVAVPKTELGKTEGSFFADLDPEVGLKESRVKFEQRRAFTYGYTGGGAVNLVYNGNEIKAHMNHFDYGFARCSDQHRPLDHFCISNAGEYRLKLTYQVFELVGDSVLKLVRFPTMEGKITITPEDLEAMKAAAIAEGVPSSASNSAPARVQAVPPLQVKSSKVLNTPHPTLAFAGYDSPDSALESYLWACSQGDKTNILKSLTPEDQENKKHAFDGKTDAQMKDDAAKIRSQLSGYTVQKMDIVSDTEVILNFTFAGSDQVQNQVQKMIVQKIGNEWKVAGPSPDSAVISVSVPSQKINTEKH
jgi:hypothetical protein